MNSGRKRNMKIHSSQLVAAPEFMASWLHRRGIQLVTIFQE